LGVATGKRVACGGKRPRSKQPEKDDDSEKGAPGPPFRMVRGGKKKRILISKKSRLTGGRFLSETVTIHRKKGGPWPRSGRGKRETILWARQLLQETH